MKKLKKALRVYLDEQVDIIESESATPAEKAAANINAAIMTAYEAGTPLVAVCIQDLSETPVPAVRGVAEIKTANKIVLEDGSSLTRVKIPASMLWKQSGAKAYFTIATKPGEDTEAEETSELVADECDTYEGVGQAE